MSDEQSATERPRYRRETDETLTAPKAITTRYLPSCLCHLRLRLLQVQHEEERGKRVKHAPQRGRLSMSQG